jgi:hypothetical protein
MHEACEDELCTNLLGSIRNKNEKRVARKMSEVLDEYPDFKPDALDIQDIFALALNSLPPRYKQKGTIVLSESVVEDEVDQAVRFAVNKVRENPKHDRRD